MSTTCPICLQHFDIPSQKPSLLMTPFGLVVIMRFWLQHMFNGRWCASNAVQFAPPADVEQGVTKYDPAYKGPAFTGRWRGPFTIPEGAK